MLYQEYTPSLPLQPYIERIWVLETGPDDVYPLEHTLISTVVVGWILSCQKVNFKFILDGEPVSLPESFMFTQPYAPWKVRIEGCSTIIGIFFKVGSLYSVLKTSMTQVVGRLIEPQAFFGSPAIRCLMEQLNEALPQDRIPLMERFLIPYFCQPHLTTFHHGLHLIQKHQGMISVEQLSQKLGVSGRTLERQFAERIGVSPKFYNRIVRFHAVQKYLMKYPQSSWLELTYRFGYFDQSHLIKDFHNFAGTTPLHFTIHDLSLSQQFLMSDRQTYSF